MKAIHRRLHRLEDQMAVTHGKPQKTVRLVSRLDCVSSLENGTCTRTPWPDGTVFEMLRFVGEREGGREATAEELDRWVASFPIEE
jgi:hypothetical protein